MISLTYFLNSSFSSLRDIQIRVIKNLISLCHANLQIKDEPPPDKCDISYPVDREVAVLQAECLTLLPPCGQKTHHKIMGGKRPDEIYKATDGPNV